MVGNYAGKVLYQIIRGLATIRYRYLVNFSRLFYQAILPYSQTHLSEL